MTHVMVLLALFFISDVFAQKPQAGWGVTIKEGDRLLKIGGRLQGIAQNRPSSEDQNLYLRRVRVNLDYAPWQGNRFSFDLRNDNSNKKHQGDGQFEIGDAYWEIKSSSEYIKHFRLFRAKVDVSYSQTSSSKNLFSPDRALPSEVASSFIVSGRRAPNAQINGAFGRTYYQLAISEGISDEDIEPINGSREVSEVLSQSLVLGGKLRYYLIGDPNKNIVQDTFYGRYDAFSIGLGHFSLDHARLGLDNGDEMTLSRKLTNLEISYSQGPFRFLAEAFLMEGIIGDIDNKTVSHGEGSYGQFEYIISKFAPYIGHEKMDYWTARDGHEVSGSYIGLNYYENMEAMRFGFRAKESRFEENVGDKTESIYQIYAMLNF